MNDLNAWTAIAAALTALGATWTYIAWQRRGVAAGLRGVAWTLLPVAAWLTGTLRLAVDISADVSNWAANFVFNPGVWLGLIVAGISVVLFGTTNRLKKRGVGTGSPAPGVKAPKGAKSKALRSKQPADDGMEDINEILKKHGIS